MLAPDGLVVVSVPLPLPQHKSDGDRGAHPLVASVESVGGAGEGESVETSGSGSGSPSEVASVVPMAPDAQPFERSLIQFARGVVQPAGFEIVEAMRVR